MSEVVCVCELQIFLLRLFSEVQEVLKQEIEQMAVNGKICSKLLIFLERCIEKNFYNIMKSPTPQEHIKTACSNRAVQKCLVIHSLFNC